jgi:peptidoglycan hydrolase CwlO-like protein
MNKEIIKTYNNLTPKEKKEEIKLLKKEIKEYEENIKRLKESLEYLINLNL